MAEQTCPECGGTIPAGAGQHADNLVSDLVTCPHCGASVSLAGGPDDAGPLPARGTTTAEAAPPGRHEADSDSLEETMGGLAEELRDKPT